MPRSAFTLLLVACLLLAGMPSEAGVLSVFELPAPHGAKDTAFGRTIGAAYKALAAHDLKRADTLIREAAAMAPKAVDPLLLRAEWARLSNRPAEVEAALRQALRLAPENAAVLSAWARFAYARSDFGTAEDYLQRAARAEPQSARRQVDLGDFYLNGGRRFDRALASYRRAAELDPRSPNALAGQGSAQLALGNRTAAFAAFGRAAELDPDNPLAYLAMARIQGTDGRYSDAIKLYERVLLLQPGLAGVLVEKADTQILAHRPADAIESYRAAIAAEPKMAVAHAKLGMACQQNGRPAEAYEAYQEAVRIDPRLAAVWNNLASLATERQERSAEALEWAQRALALSPGNAVYADTLAWVQLEARDFEGAVATLDASLAHHPDDAQLHYRRAQALDLAGDSARAAADYRLALRLNPNLPAASKAAERIRALSAK